MKGSIHQRKDTGWWYVQWYDERTHKKSRITWYKGERIYSKKTAEKLRSIMQSDFENRTFRIENYLQNGSAVIPAFEKWLKTKQKKAPATYKGYKSYLDCHFAPFFEKHPGLMLHDIQLDTLDQLLDSLRPVHNPESNLSGKMKYNIMNCFQTFMDYAWRSKQIPAIPPFPKKEDYGIQEPIVRWLSQDRQMNIINQIPVEDRPIFLWLKYHYRRPAEACALYKIDYDEINQVFSIRRSISARAHVDVTKTHNEHYIPCDPEFLPHMSGLLRPKKQSHIDTPYLFVNDRARRNGKRYSDDTLNRIWRDACKKAGEDIDLYSGLKHSSCSQFINECGGTDSELQMLTDHARLDSVKKYRKLEVSRKLELMRRKNRPNVIRLDQVKKENV